MSIFSSVPVTKLSRSTFNLDHETKLSFNFGGLYPILCQTVLPGDKMSLGLQSFVRTVPLLSPVMHRNDIKVDSFFVPMRLIWKNAEAWQECKDETIKMPVVKFQGTATLADSRYSEFMGVGSLADYLGFASIPASSFAHTGDDISASYASKRQLCALPFRTYQLIYNYYYRNKTLEKDISEVWIDSDQSVFYDILSNDDNVLLNAGDGNRTYYHDLFRLRYRSWRRDPFTSALPSPQKGNPVLIPQADIVADGPLHVDVGDEASETGLNVGFSDVNSAAKYLTHTNDVPHETANPYTFKAASYDKGLKLDPSGPTIEDFRYAEVLEEYEEALARSGAGGTGTFKEWLLSIWRTLSPDARLDRPEYLGGYRGPIQISEVPQTSGSTESSAQGNLAGKGLSVGGQLLFKNHVFKEAGYLMVIMSVVPKSSYFQGDPRQFLYDNCYEWPNPYFANLGEQEVKAMEISAAQALLNPYQQQTWGYNVRNYEMKQIPDSVHGALRTSLLYWHEARKFNDAPNSAGNVINLNTNFIKMNPLEVSRIFPSIEDSDKLIGEFYFSFKAKRSLPYYGVPRIGHTK